MMPASPLRANRDETILKVGEATVVMAYDPDGEIWFVQASSVPGLVGREGGYDDLVEALPFLIREAELP